jgi:polysaccharide biosynthesis protein PslH
VPIPKKVRNHQVNQVFKMLFVGTMGYYPNADALLFFADQIAPILREKSPQQWHLHIVGALPKNTLGKRLKYFPEIKFLGWIKDLDHEYDAADIVVVPIRGGGGTRIKILEAFAHGVPVVSTTKGAEGLDVENGVHLFIEDDARLFAEACIKLMNDHLCGDEISRRAFGLAASKYSMESINRVWTGRLPHA